MDQLSMLIWSCLIERSKILSLGTFLYLRLPSFAKFVFPSSQGNHMYVQIPPSKAKELENVLEEGKVYVFRKFLCNPSTPAFRAVESPFMIQFTRFTVIEPMPGLEGEYPFCTYSLSSFLELPEPTNTPARFVGQLSAPAFHTYTAYVACYALFPLFYLWYLVPDVIGQITSVSDIIPVQAIHQAEPSNTRTIMLKDLQLVLVPTCHLHVLHTTTINIHAYSMQHLQGE